MRSFILLALVACSPSSSPDIVPDGGADASTDAAATASITFTCGSTTPIVAGLNELEVGDRTRSFFVDLPAGTAPAGVIFSWHGYRQAAMNFRADLGFDPDAVAAHPMVIVTPNDTGLDLPRGLSWDIVQGSRDANIDLAMFEQILGCLAQQREIDAAAIYSFGFSAGAVFSNLLHARYPDLIAAIASESGAWFNDPAQVALVNYVNVPWSWPPLAASDGGTVLLTHGGPNDVTVLNILNLENAAQAALPFLAGAQRSVVNCAHTAGHTLAPQLDTLAISKFFVAQRRGAPLVAPAPLPAGCTVAE